MTNESSRAESGPSCRQARGVELARPANRPGYFRTTLADAVARRGGDLGAILRAVWIAGEWPGGPPALADPEPVATRRGLRDPSTNDLRNAFLDRLQRAGVT